MRGEKDGRAARDHPLQHRLQRAGGNGIDTLERLVQKEYLRVVDDRSSQGQLLLHAVGEVGDQLLLFVGKVHKSKQFLAALQGGRLVEAVHAPHKTEVFARGQASE